MPNLIFNNVTLGFTNNMTRESDFGGYNFSFIIDKGTFCEKVRTALETQKTQVWAASKNTDDFIIQKCNAKAKDEVTFEAVNDMMGDNDILVQVKSKNHPIENTKGVSLGRGTTADVLIDVFEYEYGKKQFLCIRAHADRGITVKVNELKAYAGAIKYFDAEVDPDKGFIPETLDEVVLC